MKPTTKRLLSRLLTFAAARAAEPSTWRGLVNLLTAAGLFSVAPETQDLMVTTALDLVQWAFTATGLIAILTPDVTPRSETPTREMP